MRQQIWQLKKATKNNYENFSNGTIIGTFRCTFCEKRSAIPDNFIEAISVDKQGDRSLNGIRQFCNENCLNLWILKYAEYFIIRNYDYVSEYDELVKQHPAF